MKSDFLLAITQLAAEKNLSKDVVIGAVETALVSAYKKDEEIAPNQNISVKINPSTGKVVVWAEKAVVEQVTDPKCEISLEEAQGLKPDVQIGENLMVEATPHNAGRIAAQTAKQVILQRLHEAEHSAIIEEYAEKEGDIVMGVVQRIEPHQVFVDVGRTEAVLPSSEQVPTERYRPGQRVKIFLLEVARTPKGPRVVVSRSHPELLRRLLEVEIPEIFNGSVELKSVSREAGFRSKIAVAARQEGIDPVGCCVGLRGIRIQNIVNELNGEKIDVVQWSPDESIFIANALSPAHVLAVELNKTDKVATAVVPDKQLSLAIGKEGQNVRLAAKLTGWRIDIKSATIAEAEKAERDRIAAELALANAEAGITEEVPVEAAEAVETAPEAPVEVVLAPPPVAPKIEKPRVRFAEEILGGATPAVAAADKAKKKKKGGVKAKEDVEGAKRQKRRKTEISLEEMNEEAP